MICFFRYSNSFLATSNYLVLLYDFDCDTEKSSYDCCYFYDSSSLSERLFYAER
jgi:hypothetical protein